MSLEMMKSWKAVVGTGVTVVLCLLHAPVETYPFFYLVYMLLASKGGQHGLESGITVFHYVFVCKVSDAIIVFCFLFQLSILGA